MVKVFVSYNCFMFLLFVLLCLYFCDSKGIIIVIVIGIEINVQKKKLNVSVISDRSDVIPYVSFTTVNIHRTGRSVPLFSYSKSESPAIRATFPVISRVGASFGDSNHR